MDILSGALAVGWGVIAVNNISKEVTRQKVKKAAKRTIEAREYDNKSHYNFNKIYITNEMEAVNWLQRIKYTQAQLYVPCAGIRYVDTYPEMSMELIDYKGDKRIISMSRILDATAKGQIRVMNAQICNAGLILQE